jgi:hypothetical protein
MPANGSSEFLSRSASNYDPLVQVTETGGQLVITPRSSYSPSSYAGYVSASEWDLTGRTASVEAQIPASNAVSIFSVGLDKDNWYSFRSKGKTLYLESRIGGSTSKSSVKYNSVDHRYWRFRHESGTDRIYFETSSNGMAWTARWNVLRTIPISALRIELVGGTGGSVPSPGQARFDNFSLLDQ